MYCLVPPAYDQRARVTMFHGVTYTQYVWHTIMTSYTLAAYRPSTMRNASSAHATQRSRVTAYMSD